ncbi:MAG: ROK family protein [Acidobacteria bacterium]|nr:ROK family protein [Acidobacteriota bacterium]
MAQYTIGIDLGGTNLRAAAIDRSGTVLEKVSGSTNLAEGREAVLSDISNVILRLRQTFGPAGLAGVGVGVPGFILLREGVIANSNNLPFLENFPFRDELEKRIGTPFILENDANAAALGEKWMGAGRDVSDLVLLTLGTGIGGGIVYGGRAMHGFLGMAAELGHITVVPDGNPCGCGNVGCLEKHASAVAISSMARLLNLGENLTARQVYELAVRGEDPARRVFSSMGRALGVALAMLVNTFNFPVYLLSGGVLAAWDFFAPSMLEEVRRRSFTFRTTNTRIEKAALAGDAGLYGAAWLPWIDGRPE